VTKLHDFLTTAEESIQSKA